MRKIVFFLTIAICLASCKKKPEFVLQGELQNCSSDEILVVYDDPVSKLDTIILKDGKFTYTFSPDTLTLFRLVSPDMLKTIPVFADKTLHMTLKGSFENPVISGDGENGVYGKFLESLQNLKDSAAIKKQKSLLYNIRTHLYQPISSTIISYKYLSLTLKRPEV